ncbi:hypothetical protein CBF31_00935 [Vagococcus fessus]|uniref:HTH cro/C1-type domain-containing protein n=1 Tax=Vagococcus fessus TaxID=120370 RepID=A0A430ABL8_9ENTE|nr:hypothetical protein CBF31_00935 [Vagococcus fessus]
MLCYDEENSRRSSHGFIRKTRCLTKKEGLSQEALAQKLNVTRQSISKWERGEAKPDSAHLIHLTQIFQTSLEDSVETIPTHFRLRRYSIPILIVLTFIASFYLHIVMTVSCFWLLIAMGYFLYRLLSLI